MESTKITPLDRLRWYEDSCATAHGLELMGERWALLIVRELMFGARRFSELRTGLPGISANVLTQRLEGFEAAGVITRRQLPSPANAQVYELTPWGYELEPVIQVLSRWAVKSPHHDPSLPLSASGAMLSFRTMVSPEKAAKANMTLGFQLGRDAFVGVLSGGELKVSRGDPSVGQAIFTAAPDALPSVAYGFVPLDEAEASGALRITGDRALALEFLTYFELPPKAA